MSLAGPPPISTNPILRVANDLQAELHAPASYPAGDAMPSIRRTHRVITDPLGLLLDAYERYGPVFSLRVLTTRVVFMLGPAANHRILVSHASDFTWRDGAFADLIPLLGDGLLTTDGDFHHRSRRIMLPAFHRERIAASLGTMESEIERAVAPWRTGDRLDLYRWARELALRVAMRALFGLDPDRRPAGLDPAGEFERALGYYGREYWLQVLRGPRTPWAALVGARRRLDGLIFSEVARRRRSGERGEDLLSLLLDASDDDGTRLSDAHVRDEVMTLLFAGHDTTTATVAFLFRELALRPDVADAIAAELAALRRPPGYEHLMGGGLPQLDLALDETLRLYPPAWIGPRRAVRTFEFEGVTVPQGAPVNYSSYASHRLPDVWEDPHEFRPERFTRDRRAALPKGAYVPFGGGSRQCIGMRFGRLEIKAIAARVLREHRLELPPGHRLEIRQTPTLGPKSGLPVSIRPA
ncbi:MAG TPA: cytochrome P450 [Solirubrobacteraceae bacterium]|nr:cytochrome P450 [Solirubrobacteraceae bacterium]